MSATSSLSAPAESIRDYQSALGARTRARTVIAVLLVLVLGAFAFQCWRTYVHFRDTGLSETQVLLGEQLQAYAPEAAAELSSAAQRVLPVYAEALQTTFERDQERYLEAVATEFSALEDYAHGETPKIQEAIAKLVLEQQAAAEHSLRTILTEEEFARISVAYQEALQAQLERTLDVHFSEHIQVADRIVQKLEQLAASEPKPLEADSQVITGMLVELLGLEMQLQGRDLAAELSEINPQP